MISPAPPSTMVMRGGPEELDAREDADATARRDRIARLIKLGEKADERLGRELREFQRLGLYRPSTWEEWCRAWTGVSARAVGYKTQYADLLDLWKAELEFDPPPTATYARPLHDLTPAQRREVAEWVDAHPSGRRWRGVTTAEVKERAERARIGSALIVRPIATGTALVLVSDSRGTGPTTLGRSMIPGHLRDAASAIRAVRRKGPRAVGGTVRAWPEEDAEELIEIARLIYDFGRDLVEPVVERWPEGPECREQQFLAV